MERAASFREYAKRPQGRFVAGNHWLAFCRTPTLWGFALWGRVEADEVPPLIEALRLELHEAVPPHASVVDTARLTGADAGGFEAFQRYVVDNHEALGRQVTSLAIVHPTGFEGAIVTGFYSVLQPPYPVALVTDVDTGLKKMGVDDDGLARALAAAVDSAAGDPLIGAVRAVLRSSPKASVHDAARRIHLSSRTLQRRLAESGTSYSTLQANARLEEALVRIKHSNAPLTSIALDVGYASTQHMSTAVKRATGRTPTELRKGEA